MYSDKVMDHFNNPRNVGSLEDANGIGEVGNARCGDIMKMYIKVKDNIITDVRSRPLAAVRHRHQLNGHRNGQG